MNENDAYFESTYRKPWTERHGFPPALVAIGWILIALVLFQLGGALFTVVVFLLDPSVPLNLETLSSISDYLGHVFVANSLSQIIFLGLGSWLIALLSVSHANRPEFLRMQSFSDTGRASLFTALLIITIQPLIWLLSWVNMQVPVSDNMIAFEESQMMLLENYLRGDHIVLLTLFHVALVPAVCEEIMYRGYVMRMLEKNWGIIAAIIISGIIFGAYHLRVTQLLPLASIGILLAYVTYKSGSLIPAIVGHLVNNGGSVLAASYYPDMVFEEYGQTFLPPLTVVLVSVLLTSALLFMMHKQIRGNKTPISGGTTNV